MKKIFILSLSLIALFLYIPKTQAATVAVGPNAGQIRDRYAGSFLVSDNNFVKQYWYVNPTTQEKYLVKNGKIVSRLLKTLGTGIHNADLNKIATSSASVLVDYELTHRMRGQILLQVEEAGQAWYVNPIDNYRYEIANGELGFEMITKLALDVSAINLRTINAVDNNNFVDHDEQLDFDMYNYVKDYLKKDFYRPDRINDADLFYGSLDGLAKSTKDPYTQFFSPQGRKNFTNGIEGEVEGIGAIVETVNNRLIIVSPLENSPASQAGLEPFDQVWKVDGLDIFGFSTTDSTARIKGPRGTKVILEIYRPSTETFFEVSITRQKIDLQNLIGKTLDNNIAYFKIGMFSNSLISEFSTLQKKLIKNNTKGVIIDLRNNPGGYSRTAINLADKWLDENSLIVKEKYNNRELEYTSHLAKEIDLPTVILTNEGTASAAEIFTSALKAHTTTQIVGQKSFGKGTGQSLLNFADDSALKYTVFEWFDPLDNSVEGRGIEPDYLIKNDNKTDLQLQKARELLK
jgi:C-terminal peptidase prc